MLVWIRFVHNKTQVSGPCIVVVLIDALPIVADVLTDPSPDILKTFTTKRFTTSCAQQNRAIS